MPLPVILGQAALRLLGTEAGRRAAKKGITAVRELAKRKNLKVTRNTKDGEIYISPGPSPGRSSVGREVWKKTQRKKKVKSAAQLAAAAGAGFAAGAAQNSPKSGNRNPKGNIVRTQGESSPVQKNKGRNPRGEMARKRALKKKRDAERRRSI